MLSALALITALAIPPNTAFGAAPLRFHDHSTGTTSGTVCGIPVEISFINTDNFFLYPDGSFKDTYSFSETFTNPVNGNAVNLSGAGQQTGHAVVDSQANTVTFTNTYKGLPEKIQTPHGPVLSRDAGVITFVNTFDLATGNLISSATVINKGPHPEADSDGALFCEVVAPALM